MVAFSRLNSRARVLLFAAIGVMTIRRNKQLYKKNKCEDSGGGEYLAKENYTVNIFIYIKR